MGPKPTHFDASGVTLGPIEARYDEEMPSVIHSWRIATLITINGQLWEKAFLPFGLDVLSVIADWNLRQTDTWRRRVV